MSRLPRPWTDRPLGQTDGFGPSDCLLGELRSDERSRDERVVLMHGGFRGEPRDLLLYPYPKRAHAENPARADFPVRPKIGSEPRGPEEVEAHNALRRMNEVLARIQELEEALDDPAQVWPRLRAAWKRAENEEDPRMAEIVRQARELTPVLRDLEKRVRRVLRRRRELTRLDRVQEMDRASMVWLSRQPGNTIAERAGSDQRILATVRRENFDTLENRVLRAYVRLAGAVAREWLREHERANRSSRYAAVDAFRKLCRLFDSQLAELGVTVAPAGITPNYVLMQDRGYRQVHEAWLRLLLRDRALDDLWAWQAQTWTDFAVLAIVLALDDLDGAEMIAQSPIIWREEAYTGRWFEQDRPLAVFWLRQIGRVVEVQARPEAPGSMLTAARAHVALRISDPSGQDIDRRVAVWTPHAMQRLTLGAAADGAFAWLEMLQRAAQSEILRDGLILTPAHEEPEVIRRGNARISVEAIALGASGYALSAGITALKAFVEAEFSEVPR